MSDAARLRVVQNFKGFLGDSERSAFSITLDNKAEFDISRLENAMLQTTYPALRSALSEHLEDASKKKSL